MKKLILKQSHAVRTNVLPDIKQTLENFPLDLDNVTHYTTNIKEWLKPVIDLSDFNVYPMNGITEGLNWWSSIETRSIIVEKGDYQWVQQKEGIGSIKYMSVPASLDGNFKEVPTDVPIALDLAYIGSTEIRKINVTDNIEYVFYSLSKPFGIRNIRTGWYFTRKKDTRLDSLIYGAKYFNYTARNISEKIISEYPIDYVYNNLRSKQLSVCSELGFTPSDTVWLATTTDSEYDQFKRADKINRICLSPIL